MKNSTGTEVIIMDIPKRATKEQIKAMTETEGNIRVSSVPGSGKTFVLTYRIAYLITELYVEPSSIVALTFTNKGCLPFLAVCMGICL